MAERALSVTPAGRLVPSTGRPRLEQSPVEVYLRDKGKAAKRAYRADLQVIGQLLTGGQWTKESRGRGQWTVTGGDPEAYLSLPWEWIGEQEAAVIRSELVQHYTPKGADRKLVALRGVLETARKLTRRQYQVAMAKAPTAQGQMTLAMQSQVAQDGLQDAIDALKPARGSSPPAGRHIDAGEIQALFRACQADKTPAGARDAAMLAVLYGGGLRRSEAVALNVVDFDARTGALTIRYGKGNKSRVTYAENGAATYLFDWLVIRNEATGNPAGPLFCPIDKAGRLKLQRMTSQAVWNALQKRAAQAGVRAFSPHDLRRTYISDLLDAGADIATVQKLAGHASVTTTARYDRRPEKAKQRAASLLHVPYYERD